MKNNFIKRLKKLPIDIQNIITSDKLGEIISDALRLANVSEDKFDTIMEATSDVLLFYSPKERFTERIKTANLPATAINIIDKVIQEKVFKSLENELEQYKYLLAGKSLQKDRFSDTKPLAQELKKEPSAVSIPQKSLARQEPTKEQIAQPEAIPETNYPEPQEIKIERPLSKSGELKKVSSPSVTPEQQEKIRQKLVEVMAKQETHQEIVSQMKKVAEEKETAKTKEETKKKKVELKESPQSIMPSEVKAGINGKFKDGDKNLKSAQKDKPHIFDVRLKEEEKKERKIEEKPIPYKKYAPEEPFGEA